MVDCSTNKLTVQWDARAGAVVSYMAFAIGSDGSSLSCQTSLTECVISTLNCGLTYGITVIPSTANCGNIETADYQIQSGERGRGNWIHVGNIFIPVNGYLRYVRQLI